MGLTLPFLRDGHRAQRGPKDRASARTVLETRLLCGVRCQGISGGFPCPPPPGLFRLQCQPCRLTSRPPPTAGETSLEVGSKGNPGTFSKPEQGKVALFLFGLVFFSFFLFLFLLFWFGFRGWQGEGSGLMGGWAVQHFFFFPSPLPPSCCFVLRRGLGRGELVKIAPAVREPRLGARFTKKPICDCAERERVRREIKL